MFRKRLLLSEVYSPKDSTTKHSRLPQETWAVHNQLEKTVCFIVFSYFGGLLFC